MLGLLPYLLKALSAVDWLVGLFHKKDEEKANDAKNEVDALSDADVDKQLHDHWTRK